MQRIMTGIALASLLVGSVALAQDTTDQNMGTSTTSTENMGRSGLANETLSVKPEVGVATFTNTAGSDNSRGAAGLDIEYNLSGMAAGMSGTPLYLGVQTGIIYSHIGTASGNFFGGNGDSNATSPGANMLLIPADLKLGWNVTDSFRLSAHGGANVIYRSIQTAMQLGTPNGNTGSAWSFYPNVGADLDFALLPRLTLLIRPDVTLTPGPDLYSGMVGLGFSLG